VSALWDELERDALRSQLAGLRDEIKAVRDEHVQDQVSRALEAAEGGFSRAQIDDCEIQVRMRWAKQHPAMARVLKIHPA
jgi:hypothetical protein